MCTKAMTLLVLMAVLVCVLAAGTPVIGDPSVRATTAGINLSHTAQKPPKIAPPPITDRLAALVAQLAVLSLGWVVSVVVVDPSWTKTAWRERRTSRGPPRLALA